MADIHILEGGLRDNVYYKRCAFHYAVPAPDQIANAANDPDLVNFVSAVPNLATDDATENAAIKAGTIVEEVVTVRMGAGATAADKLQLARDAYAANQLPALNRYRAKYYEYMNTFTAT